MAVEGWCMAPDGTEGDDGSDGELDPDEEVAADVADDTDALLRLVSDFYRGSVNQTTNSQNRIDQTTNWAITLIAALLSVVLSSPDVPAYLLLVGIVVLCVFLSYEVRRYRFYDLYRSRVRFVEENVVANALDPSGVEHAHWREELGGDLRTPTFKVSVREALSRRVRRIYGLLFAVLGVAWLAKGTLFTPEASWVESMAVPGVSGVVVAGALAGFYVLVAAVALWPGERAAKGEVRESEPGTWKRE